MMKRLFAYLLLSYLLFASSCEKEEKLTYGSTNSNEQIHSGHVFNVKDQAGKTEAEYTQTVLGRQRNNPYSIENLNIAYFSLYNIESNILPTHRYIKFSPQTAEEFNALMETEEVFYDYPLEYEVITMGDYYQILGEEDLPELYAVVDINFNLPNITYQVIDELNLDKSNLLLLIESFRLTDNVNDIEGSLNLGDFEPADDLDGLVPAPDCDPGYVPEFYVDENGFPAWRCVLYLPPVPDPVYNSFGCLTHGDDEKPAGKIRLEDTELSTTNSPSTFVGVRNVKVILKDNWFAEEVVYTNNDGCFRVNEKFGNVAWMWVKFENNDSKIRCSINTVGSWLTQFLWTTKGYIGKINGPTFNNIGVNFHKSNIQGSKTHRIWAVATLHNGVQEFYDFAANHCLATVNNKIDIYAGINSTRAYTLMGGQFYVASNTNTQFISLAGILYGIPAGIINASLFVSYVGYLPEMMVGVEENNDSKIIKQRLYNELAHSTH